jgi:hypothetical protein
MSKSVHITELNRTIGLCNPYVFYANVLGSVSDACSIDNSISRKANGSLQVDDDKYVSFSHRYIGTFKTNRSRVNQWYNNCNQQGM